MRHRGRAYDSAIFVILSAAMDLLFFCHPEAKPLLPIVIPRQRRCLPLSSQATPRDLLTAVIPRLRRDLLTAVIPRQRRGTCFWSTSCADFPTGPILDSPRTAAQESARPKTHWPHYALDTSTAIEWPRSTSSC